MSTNKTTDRKPIEKVSKQAAKMFEPDYRIMRIRYFPKLSEALKYVEQTLSFRNWKERS